MSEQSTPTYERVFVDVPLALELLKANSTNRELRNHVVEGYVDQMKKGQWREDTGETIKISKTGRLLDGQHRLNAIVKFGSGFHLTLA